MRIIFVVGLIIFTFPCYGQRDKKSSENIFYQTMVDTNVVQNLYLYDSLRNIILSNIDTLFKFKNKTNFVFYADKKRSIQEDAYSYRFNYYPDGVKRPHDTVEEARKNDPYSLDKMPAFIYPYIENIFKKIGNDKIKGFRISVDSTIQIDIKHDYYPSELIYVDHFLTWGRFYENNTELKYFTRDILLAPKWIYTFLVRDRY
ncbi:MAG: hypothetical protein V4685_18530 [Bacteroidota bacterium]